MKKDVQKAAKINKASFPEDAFAKGPHSQETFKEDHDEKSNAKLIDLFRPAKIFWRTICMFYNWMVRTCLTKY